MSTTSGFLGQRPRFTYVRRTLFGLFGSAPAALVTVFLAAVTLKLLLYVLDWAFVEAVWTIPDRLNDRPDLTLCEKARGVGACWPAVLLRYQFLIFGRYPSEIIWRPWAAILMLLALFAYSGWRQLRGAELPFLWLTTFFLCLLIMGGGVAGLQQVPTELWGGLPLTLLITTAAILGALPIGALLALGRVNLRWSGIRLASILYIETVRGLPLISLLFMGNFLLPVILPAWATPNALTRAIIAITLFAAAYVAEVVRAGLRAIPIGQREAADALGLPVWVRTWKIILPQALLLVLAPLLNTFISTLKDTTLILIIGLLDLFSTAQSSVANPLWQEYYVEIYVFTAAIYFILSFGMSRISAHLESRQFKSR